PSEFVSKFCQPDSHNEKRAHVTMKGEHWRIRILDFGGDGGWRWHRERAKPAEFSSKASALEKIETLEAFELAHGAVAEAVWIPATENADMYLGNIPDQGG